MSQVSYFDALFGGNNGTLAGGSAEVEAPVDLNAGGPTRASKYCPKGEVPDHRKGREGRCRHVSRMRKNRSHPVCAPGSVRDRRKGRSGCRNIATMRRNSRRVPREFTMRRGPRMRSNSPGVSMTKYYRQYMKDRKKSQLRA